MIARSNWYSERDALRQQLSEVRGKPPADRLWILSDDSHMNSLEERIVTVNGALVIRCKENEIDAKNENVESLVRAIVCAIEEHGVRDVIVCGHSHGASSEGKSLTGGDGLRSSTRVGLLASVRDRQQTNDALREKVLQRAKTLKKMLNGAKAVVAIHAAFYLNESGVFQHYDPATKRFVALCGHPASI